MDETKTTSWANYESRLAAMTDDALREEIAGKIRAWRGLRGRDQVFQYGVYLNLWRWARAHGKGHLADEAEALVKEERRQKAEQDLAERSAG